MASVDLGCCCDLLDVRFEDPSAWMYCCPLPWTLRGRCRNLGELGCCQYVASTVDLDTMDVASMAAVDAMLLKKEGSPLRSPVVGVTDWSWRRCYPIDLGLLFNTLARYACYPPEQMVADDRSKQRKNLLDMRKEDGFVREDKRRLSGNVSRCGRIRSGINSSLRIY
ncbi:hypothetical protein ACLOJK_028415 [Asimina triloba]